MTASEPFLEHRSLLFAIAYRMLGSVADAEDAVQETYLRWRRATEHGEEIRSPKAWLTTTISRVCLDQLGSARVKREQYIGPWLPEPLAGVTPDVAETVADFDSLSLAFLVLLESLSPKERAVFLLHDVFGYDFASIGDIVGESDAYCRQLGKAGPGTHGRTPPPFHGRSRPAGAAHGRLPARRVRGRHAGPHRDPDRRCDRLLRRRRQGQRGSQTGRRSRQGGTVPDQPRAPRTAGTSFRIEPINGQPGIVTLIDGAVRNVVTFDFADSAIRTIYIVVNPDKLRPVASSCPASIHEDREPSALTSSIS